MRNHWIKYYVMWGKKMNGAESAFSHLVFAFLIYRMATALKTLAKNVVSKQILSPLPQNCSQLMFNQGEYVFRGIFFLLFICPHFFPCKKKNKTAVVSICLESPSHQSLFLSAQGAVLCGGSRCEHHLQQDPGTGPPSESPLPDSPRRHHSHWRRRPAGHQ